jgi:hypothetical protein
LEQCRVYDPPQVISDRGAAETHNPFDKADDSLAQLRIGAIGGSLSGRRLSGVHIAA